jgi:neutral ceramidase
MPLPLILCSLIFLAYASTPVNAADHWKAGAASVNVTPTNSIWLTGFAARTNASRGKLQELYVKALALEDVTGKRAVLITSDLLGFPAVVSERIARKAEKRHRISRDSILFNSSHTHGAPALASPIHFIYGPQATPEQWQQIEDYTRDLESKVVSVIGTALKELKAAQVSFGQGKTDFGVNRRKMTASGIQSFVPNPDGPVDPAVPVLRVASLKGEVIAVVFGYAAHPTTIHTGNNFYDISGDFAGFAQEYVEKQYPGAVAMFVQGCGGDIMVYPRGTVELAHAYGETLSAEVARVLKNPLQPVTARIGVAFDTFPVKFAPGPSREALQQQLKTGDLYHRWHAAEMLKKLDEKGDLPKTYPYPLQVWQLGSEVTMIALAGEVVADYAVRLKKELGPEKLWVAGYCNDVFAYIPSARVLQEGGYEGEGAMIYYMQPGKFDSSIEETIIGKSHELVKRVSSKRGEKK